MLARLGCERPLIDRRDRRADPRRGADAVQRARLHRHDRPRAGRRLRPHAGGDLQPLRLQGGAAVRDRRPRARPRRRRAVGDAARRRRRPAARSSRRSRPRSRRFTSRGRARRASPTATTSTCRARSATASCAGAGACARCSPTCCARASGAAPSRSASSAPRTRSRPRAWRSSTWSCSSRSGSTRRAPAARPTRPRCTAGSRCGSRAAARGRDHSTRPPKRSSIQATAKRVSSRGVEEVALGLPDRAADADPGGQRGAGDDREVVLVVAELLVGQRARAPTCRCRCRSARRRRRPARRGPRTSPGACAARARSPRRGAAA